MTFCDGSKFDVSFCLGLINVFGPTDGAFETAQSAGLIPTDPNGEIFNTGWARLIRSHSSARFSFELSGNSNYIIHCNSNYVQNFELEINLI